MKTLEELEEERAHACRLTTDRALATLDDAEAFLLDRGMLSKTDFSEKKKVEDLAKAIRVFDFERAEVVADEEHSGWALELVQRVNGVPRSARIDADFVSGYEMKRIRETTKSIGGFLDGPYVVQRNGETESHQTLPAVVDAI